MPAGRLRKTIRRNIKLTIDKKQNKEIKKLKTQVKKLSKADEKKWYDVDKPSTAIPLSGTVQPLLNLDIWAGDNILRIDF